MLKFLLIQSSAIQDLEAIQRLLAYSLEPLDVWTTAVIPDALALMQYRYAIMAGLMRLSEGLAGFGMDLLSKAQQREVLSCIEMARRNVHLGNMEPFPRTGSLVIAGAQADNVGSGKPGWETKLRKALSSRK